MIVLGTWEYGIIHVIWQQVDLFDTIRQERYYLSTFSCMSFPVLTRVRADEKDNTRYAFLQLDDRVLVYRGADQPDMSVINPESDVWQHIKVRPPIKRKGEKLIPDPKRIHIDKLANPLRFNFVRRETNSHSRKTWVNSLLRCIWSMEVV
jgi:hypothetical protein